MTNDVTFWSLFKADMWGVVIALGGIPIIVGGLAGWIGGWLKDRHLASYKASLDRDAAAYRADLDTRAEAHKAALKREELIFNKRIEAASELSTAIHEFDDSSIPREASKTDRYRAAASHIRDSISTIIGKYAPVFPDAVRSRMKSVYVKASTLQKEAHRADPLEKGSPARPMASDLISELRTLEAEIVELISK